MAAENYHLKWDSHLSYLNNSIATLYKNEKFADVVLYSSYSSCSVSSDIPTVGISAHKFILSSCSQFFATMFETSPITTPNGVLYIVLPPDISHRAIQILVQYMYSGEATVSNDILNEVLRGGEVLKIRGLCRTSSSNGCNSSNNNNNTAQSSSTSSVSSSHQHHHHHHALGGGPLNQRESGAIYVPNSARTVLPPPPPQMSIQLPGDLYGNKANSNSNSNTSRFGLDHHHHTHQQQHQLHQQQQQQFRGLGASVMPKDSPVIVKSPKMATHTGLLSVTSSSKLHGGVGGISVNKEVAIDPEDKCCYPSSQVESLQQPPTSSLSAPMTICTEVGCNSCPLQAPSAEPEPSMRRRDYGERLSDDHNSICDRDELGLAFKHRLRRESACERAHDYFVHDTASHYEQQQQQPQQHTAKSYMGEPTTLASPPHSRSFLTIKQEPTDWSTNPPPPPQPPQPPTNKNKININENELSTESQMSPKQPLDFKISAVKLEANRATPDEDQDEHTLRDYNNFKLLVCEICQKSFDDTKALVRHLGTHASDSTERVQSTNICSSSMAASSSSGSGSSSNASGSTNNLALRALKTYVPKKRRRVSQQENNVDHVTLLCDLCSTSFETPADWVRHMNSQHTEIELAMFNSKKDGEQKSHASSTSTTSNNQLQQHGSAVVQKKYSSVNRQSLISQKRGGSSSSGSSNNNSGTAANSGNIVGTVGVIGGPSGRVIPSPGLAATSSHA